MPIITCSATGKTQEAKQCKNVLSLPRGWKRHAGSVYCADAWKQRFVVRAITMPVVSPVLDSETPDAKRDAWKSLREACKQSWRASTQLANWAVKELLKNDVTRTDDMKKLPVMPKIYLYGMRDFIGWSQSAVAVLRTVEATYRSKRYDRIWLGKVRLPDTRYPYPYPVHNAAWNAYFDESNRPCVLIPLNSGRVSVRLKGGNEYRRQLAGFRQIVNGEAVHGELSVYERGNQIAIKMVAWFPKRQWSESKGELIVRTDADSFLVGLNAKDAKLFVINGDRMRMWYTKHQRWQQRFREDQKMETRRPATSRQARHKPMGDGAEKFRNRLNSFIDESAAQIVNYASRRRLATIRYDDSQQDYFRNFPWAGFRNLIAQKCNDRGIEFLYDASGPVANKTS